MKPSLAGMSLIVGTVLTVMVAAGCAGKGETHVLSFQAKPPAAQPSGVEPVKIVIEPFEDRRANKAHIGARSHLWGGVTRFDVAGGHPADVVTQALVTRLKSRGWGERPWNVRLGQAGSEADADIVISGQIQDFSANARSRVFSTVIDTKNLMTIQAKNLGDKSTTTRTIEGAQTRTVFWFNEADVQELLAATVMDGIDRLVADTKIAEKALRPAR
ncbi:MAG TPA: hypothetical protein VFX56_02320 [Nitrospira sp.]|nr:hypothetical protein [Nitrospira sp.]